MRLNLEGPDPVAEVVEEAKCGNCQDVLTDIVAEDRGICEECWTFSSEEKADIVAEGLIKEVEGFSPILQTLMGTHPQLKIARIKDVRQHTGLNLKHAKSVVDKVNSIVPVVEAAKVTTELKELKAKVSANKWRDKDVLALEAELTDIRARLTEEAGETYRLRLSSQNLEARLGASNRELLELNKEVVHFRNSLLAVEKVAEALKLVAKGDVPCSLASALTTLIEDALPGSDASF